MAKVYVSTFDREELEEDDSELDVVDDEVTELVLSPDSSVDVAVEVEDASPPQEASEIASDALASTNKVLFFMVVSSN